MAARPCLTTGSASRELRARHRVRQVRLPRQGRGGRDGRDLQGACRRAGWLREDPRHQEDPACLRAEPGLHQDAHRRSQGELGAAARQHRPDLRAGGDRRAVLHRDGVRVRRGSASRPDRLHAGGGQAGRRAGALYHQRDLQGARLRARGHRHQGAAPQHHSSGRVALEHPDELRRRREDHGLRRRTRRPRARQQGPAPEHGQRGAQGQARVHVARAGHRRRDRPALRHLRAGHHPVRGAHAEASVPRQDRPRDADQHPRRQDRQEAASPQLHLGRHPGHAAQGAREGPARPLSDGDRLPGGDPRLPVREPHPGLEPQVAGLPGRAPWPGEHRSAVGSGRPDQARRGAASRDQEARPVGADAHHWSPAQR